MVSFWGEVRWGRREIATEFLYVSNFHLCLQSSRLLQKNPPCPFIVSGSMEHGLPNGFWLQNRPQTLSWPMVSAWAVDIDMAFTWAAGPWIPAWHYRQHRPWTSTWSLVVTQNMNINMASGGSTHHRHPCSPWPQHGP